MHHMDETPLGEELEDKCWIQGHLSKFSDGIHPALQWPWATFIIMGENLYDSLGNYTGGVAQLNLMCLKDTSIFFGDNLPVVALGNSFKYSQTN